MKASKIHFQKENATGFYSTLKTRINEFQKTSANKTSYYPATKSISLLLLYFLAFALIFRIHNQSGIILTYILLGGLTIGIFLNIVHDAAHNALFKNSIWNNFSIHLLELFGTDSHIWKKRHLVSHHSYPNINGKDHDIKQTNLLRVIPNAPFLAHHAFQPYYVPFIYLLYTLNWFFHRDLVDAFFHYEELHISNIRRVKLIIQKIIYLFSFIVLPSMLTGLSIGIYLTGFILMHFTASTLGVMALTTAHVSHDSEFPEPDENGLMPDSWAMHQLRVTQDFATNSFLINSCFGGFNFHVAHHLFPTIQHRHYKKITCIIKKTAEEFGLEYKYKTLGAALWSHYLLIINNSRKPIEIDM